MAQMKTPGVYIIEKNAFPNSVVEVATAIPAFIGHTQFARDGNKDLTGWFRHKKAFQVVSYSFLELYVTG